MARDHGHGHGHGHGPARDNERRVLTAMLLTGGFMLAEVVGGVLAGSLALLADAGHMLTDTASLTLAWFAFRIGRRGHDRKRTYGYHRFQVLAAFVNGLTLIAIVGWIAIEAVRRMLEPVEVAGGLMLAIAGLGLLVNIAAFVILHGGDRENLNIRGAALHVLGDLLGSVAAIAAALIIMSTGWTAADPLLSLLVAGLIARSAWLLVRKSGHILLEGAPEWLDVGELRQDLTEAVPDVRDVHHVHVWMLTSERPLITLHATTRGEAGAPATLAAIRSFLAERYGIDHATVQIEPDGCVDAAHPGEAAA
ncbi:MAG TPA: cation diffusion facilitator family transporter [Geminicoccaceae bacterium]